MRVVINQSDYIPWKGYFDLIHDADLFIFLDDVQYTKNDWRNRNRIKGPNGTHWITIPVGGSTSQRVCDVMLPAGSWAKKHWHALSQSYGGCPHFATYASLLQEAITRPGHLTLSEFNQFLIRLIAREILGIPVHFLSSSELPVHGVGQDRVLALLAAVGATTYISGPAGKHYLDERRFSDAGIKLVWKDYSGYPEYPQPYPPFEHAVSIVDVLFAAGPEAPKYIWHWREHALT